jgi:hypothetical protein
MAVRRICLFIYSTTIHHILLKRPRFRIVDLQAFLMWNDFRERHNLWGSKIAPTEEISRIGKEKAEWKKRCSVTCENTVMAPQAYLTEDWDGGFAIHGYLRRLTLQCPNVWGRGPAPTVAQSINRIFQPPQLTIRLFLQQAGAVGNSPRPLEYERANYKSSTQALIIRDCCSAEIDLDILLHIPN